MSPDEKKGLKYLQENAAALDLNRRVSFGEGGVKNYLNQGKSAEKFGMVITNDTDKVHTLIFGALNSIYASAARLKTEVGGIATAVIITDGRLVTHATKAGLEVTAKGANRKVADFVNYLNDTPSTLIGIKFESSVLATKAPESTNFNQIIKNIYISPFRNPRITTEVDLRDMRNDGVVAAQYMNVDFLKRGDNVLLSRQNYLVFDIEPGTSLSLSTSYGAQMSNAQDLYRQNNAAAQAMTPMTIGSSCDC